MTKIKKPIPLYLKIIMSSVLFLLCLFIFYYFALPFLNFTSPQFYVILALVVAYVLAIIFICLKDKMFKNYTLDNKLKIASFDYRAIVAAIFFSFVGFFILLLVFSFFGTKLVSSKAYAKQLKVAEGTEEELLENFDFNDGEVLLPIIDKELAYRLAQASLGDYGAQYTIDYDNFTLLSVSRNGKDELVRIAPLEYSNFFVSVHKYNEGSIGYIEVNVVTKETKLVKVEGGMKYMPSAIFGKDLERHVHFHYPGTLYDEINFEIDDNGKPYWVIPTEKKEIGVISGSTAKGVITVDPVTGEIHKYKIGEEPKWIDRVVDAKLVGTQATNNLKFKNGFMNVYFGSKKDVFQLSDGYNYFIKNGNTYYVSCITSPNKGDQTSIGFITVNLKNREAVKYMVSGITEERAREIAKNDARVKAQTLEATWPILINYQGVETYFLVLKNDVQEQKMVFINVKNGSLIAMGNTMKEAQAEYDKLLADNGKTETESITITGKVTKIRDLNTSIEFMLDSNNDKYFVVSPSVSLDARFMNVSDKVEVIVKDYGTYYYVISLIKK